jgi:ferrous iron transport protein A
MSQILPLSELPNRTKARILEIQGGYRFQQRLTVMGIRKGQIVTLISKQPFRGPITIQLYGSQMTLGRGMARRIMVEVMT